MLKNPAIKTQKQGWSWLCCWGSWVPWSKDFREGEGGIL